MWLPVSAIHDYLSLIQGYWKHWFELPAPAASQGFTQTSIMQQKTLIKASSTAAALGRGCVLLPWAMYPASHWAHLSHLQASVALPWLCLPPAGWRQWDEMVYPLRNIHLINSYSWYCIYLVFTMIFTWNILCLGGEKMLNQILLRLFPNELNMRCWNTVLWITFLW